MADGVDREDGMRPDDGTTTDDAALATAARHALHDEALVVALATGSLEDDAEVGRATALVDRCTACRDLHRDIATIGDALRADARGTVAAPRDFRLTVEDARRLGGPVSVGGFAAAFRRSLAAFAGTAGASMAALGIVGLLVGSLALSGGAGSAPMTGGFGSTTASGAPMENQAGVQEPGPKSTDLSIAMGPAPTAGAAATRLDTQRDAIVPAAGPNTATWLLGGSAALLVGGLALLFVTFRRGRRGGARESRD